MYPATPGMSVPLANGAVEAVVEQLRARGHLRLEHVHLVRAHELVNRILRVLEVDEHPGARRTGFTTRRGQALRDAVVTQRALVRRVGARVEIPAAVRARLD